MRMKKVIVARRVAKTEANQMFSLIIPKSMQDFTPCGNHTILHQMGKGRVSNVILFNIKLKFLRCM